MRNKELIEILKNEVAALGAELRNLHQASHVVYWKFGVKEAKEKKTKEWIILDESLKRAESIMQTTRHFKI